MAETIRLVAPRKIEPNPENPRLIFRPEELAELQDSIREQGILVPLTVYEDGRRLVLLDGERRWRCATRLRLPEVPVIVQPKPERLQNIMMMFAIHNTRRDWDPLPAALKLEELEKEFNRQHGRTPNERELAGLASITRGEVRRLRTLLRLPERYRSDLLAELEKPRHEQALTVDQVLETIRGVDALAKREVIDEDEEEDLRAAIIEKFRMGKIASTVDPRKLARMARALDRGEVAERSVNRVVARLITEPEYSIQDAFAATVESVDFQHGTEQLADRVTARMLMLADRQYELSDSLRASLRALHKQITALLRQ